MCFKKQALEKYLGCMQCCHSMRSYVFVKGESIAAQKSLVKVSRDEAAAVNLLQVVGG